MSLAEGTPVSINNQTAKQFPTEQRSSSKLSKYTLTQGKYTCNICTRKLSSKQRVLIHLHNIHGLTPVKREKKKYLDDAAADVPRRTISRWKKQRLQGKCGRRSLESVFTMSLNGNALFEEVDKDTMSDENITSTSEMYFGLDSSESNGGDLVNDNALDSCLMKESHGDCDCDFTDPLIVNKLSDESSVKSDELQPLACNLNLSEDEVLESHFDAASCLELTNGSDEEASSENHSESDSEIISINRSLIEEEFDETSDPLISEGESDETSDPLTSEEESDETTDPLSSSDINSTDDEQDMSYSSVKEVSSQTLPKNKFHALSLLSCFLRNKFSESTNRDVITTLKRTFFDSEAISQLDYDEMLSHIEESTMKEIHYCVECGKTFPENLDIFLCSSPNCNGLRYKGPLSGQLKKGRHPRQCFVMADVEKQLCDLLQTEGIWEEIMSRKSAAYDRSESGSNFITDVMDGSAYREMVSDGGFLDTKANNISAFFNTDGVNLYSSSKIELWPIFLAINELSPSKRFARDNVLLVGLWQGKGKPPFEEFFKFFSQQMNKLYTDGVRIHIGKNEFTVKLSVLGGITDLPAKAEVLNMSYFNGIAV